MNGTSEASGGRHAPHRLDRVREDDLAEGVPLGRCVRPAERKRWGAPSASTIGYKGVARRQTHPPWSNLICLTQVDLPLSPAPRSSSLISFRAAFSSSLSCCSMARLPGG